MGNIQTAIATVCGGVLMVIVFILLHFLKKPHFQYELVMAVYGISVGMAISFVLFLWCKVTSDNRGYVNALSNIAFLAIVLLSLHFMRPRKSPPKWLLLGVWLVMTVSASALCICFSQIIMGVH